MGRKPISRMFAGLALAALMALGLAGPAIAQESSPESGSSFPVTITFVNGLTSLDSVDVYINGDEEGERVIEGLEYGTTSEAFEGTAPGTVIVVKQNVNWGVDRYLFNTLISTGAGKNYVVVISDFMILPVEFDLSPTVDEGARTIGIHASSQAPAVDVYVTPSGQEFSIGDVVPLITDLAYGRVTTGGAALPGTRPTAVRRSSGAGTGSRP